MPQLGETVTEGKITKWFKAAGDAIKPGDNLFEIETDKTSMEVPATSAGTLSAIHFGVGQVAAVGAVVAVITGAGEAANATLAVAPQVAVVRPPTAALAVTPAVQATPMQRAVPLDPFNEVRSPARNFGPARIGGVSVTPLARRLAAEHGIDLTQVRGSGPQGRIVAADIERSAPASGRVRATGASAAEVKALFSGVAYEEVPLSAMRRTIATRLTEAKQTVPHFYLTADVDVGRLLTMREEANAAAPKGADGEPAFRLSLNDFIIKAWAAALMRTPAANAVWAEDRILRFTRADIGVAVALEDGLITPVIRHVERKSITALSAEIRDLAQRARDRKLQPDEYRGGSSAISNLGMYGVREFAAIINPPQASILAVGTARRAPIEDANGGVKFVSQMTVTLSCDHRVIDGAVGAVLLAAFAQLVEQPLGFLV